MSNEKDIRVLIVEDDQELLTNVVELFEIFGFQVSSARNGLEALDHLTKKPCDILLTDIRMPQMDGIELLKRVKQIDPNKPKVVMLSGYTDQSVDELMNMGADAFFSKPFDASAVRNCLNQTLLNPTQRWSDKKNVTPNINIQLKINNLDDGFKTKKFSLGRTGFFLNQTLGKPKVGDWVQFQIEISDNKPCHNIAGLGQVIWVREKSDSTHTAGAGIEFRSLEPSTLKNIEPWYSNQKIIASIPSL